MSTTSLLPYPLAYPSPTVRFLVEAWWTCHSVGQHTWRNRSDCLLAPACPFSVVPLEICQRFDLEITPFPGCQAVAPTWFGISCRVGRALLWLPVLDPPGGYRSFS